MKSGCGTACVPLCSCAPVGICMHLCVCLSAPTWASVCVCTCVCACVYLWASVCTCVCACTYLWAFVHLCVCLWASVCVHLCVCLCTPVGIPVHLCALVGMLCAPVCVPVRTCGQLCAVCTCVCVSLCAPVGIHVLCACLCTPVGIRVLCAPVGICVLGSQEGAVVTLPYSSSLQKPDMNSQLGDEHSRSGVHVGRPFSSNAGPPLRGHLSGGVGCDLPAWQSGGAGWHRVEACKRGSRRGTAWIGLTARECCSEAHLISLLIPS